MICVKCKEPIAGTEAICGHGTHYGGCPKDEKPAVRHNGVVSVAIESDSLDDVHDAQEAIIAAINACLAKRGIVGSISEDTWEEEGA